MLSLLIYNSDTRTIKETGKRKLRLFEMAILRKIVGVTRGNRIGDNNIVNYLKLKKDIIDGI